jgi:H+/Cl- antiporter ClcA
MTWGRIWWPIYLLVSLAVFLGPEIFALVTNWRNTLSNWVWSSLKVSSGRFDIWHESAPWYLTLGCWIVLITWLTFHFFFRRFT